MGKIVILLHPTIKLFPHLAQVNKRVEDNFLRSLESLWHEEEHKECRKED